MTVLVADPIVDTVLDRYASTVGDSLTDYRNHLYRGMNYQLRLLGMTQAPPEIALAWATHDIGIWTAVHVSVMLVSWGFVSSCG